MYKHRAVVFVDIFPPSMGGGATRAFCIMQSLVALGFHVTVITTACIYPIGKSIFALRLRPEQQSNLTIIRVPSLNLPFKGLLNRILNYSISGLSMLVESSKMKKIDLIFSIGMHPFTDFGAYLVKVANSKSHFIVDISDVFPEESLFRLTGHALNRSLLQMSDSITVHNKRMKQLFETRYDYHKQIVVLHNSVDTRAVSYTHL